jgi:hypothetical protein
MLPVPWYHVIDDPKGNTLILNLHVQPGAKRTEVAGPHGDALKIRLSAHPVEGAANAELIELVACAFWGAATAGNAETGRQIPPQGGRSQGSPFRSGSVIHPNSKSGITLVHLKQSICTGFENAGGRNYLAMVMLGTPRRGISEMVIWNNRYSIWNASRFQRASGPAVSTV